MTNASSLPGNLPIPEDDGACDHLPGTTLPDVALQSTTGDQVPLNDLSGRNVIFCYPRIAGPDEAVPEDWNRIPGARGCTPESCAFRDLYREFQSLNVDVYGLSTQGTDDQQEASERLHLPYPLLSDADHVVTHSLNLPTLTWRDRQWMRRLTLIVQDGSVEHVFYPVFPPDTHADDVLAWLRSHDANAS